MLTTVLFDLDGTLLPFEQEDFIKLYFAGLGKKLAPLGYDPRSVVKSVWAGTGAMVKNDGSRTNSEAFWQTFRELNKGLPDAQSQCDDFYIHEFDAIQSCLKRRPHHKPLMDRLKASGLKLVLATNPIFPLPGVRTRMDWVGLAPEDFELVTYYDNSTYCKPNPDYYREILAKIGEKPENCIMVGNNVTEDMIAASLGMKVFLVNEFLENPENKDASVFPQGSVEDAERYIASVR